MSRISADRLSAADADRLLAYGESCLEAAVRGTGAEPPPDIAVLSEQFGAFATLRSRGNLRGCIGTFAGARRLGQILPQMVHDAALCDHRFSPVEERELPAVSLELSILGRAAAVCGPQKIRLGSDGIILEVDGRRSVFLPEVASDQGWDLEETLSQLSRKAGLSGSAWKAANAEFKTFRSLKIKRDPDQGGTVAVRLL